jgi:acetolactate synthase I/II/III large subunit
MPMMTGGQALIQQIKREGIETIFGLPGVQLDWAFDALYDERDHFRIVHTRHEQATAYMADGYARSTGKIGMCLVVPGPGLLNASAALSTAYACSSPVLCVTGQIDSRLIGLGRGILHEIPNQMEAIASVTKWQGRAMTPAEIPGLVHEAFRQLRTGRPRPVEIEVPEDILRAPGEVQLLDFTHEGRPGPDLDLIDAGAQALGKARSPLIFVGGGVLRSGAWTELQQLAEMLEAPVASTVNGRGALSDRHHLAVTDLIATELAPQTDVILVVGSRFVVGANVSWEKGAKTVIQMDVDPEEIGRNYPTDIALLADAKAGLAALVERVPRYNRARASRKDELIARKEALAAKAAGQQLQAELALAIRAELPDDGILVTESTQVGYWTQGYFPVYAPRTFFTSGYQGTLGFGFATALGVQVGNPDRKVVSISGDGGFFFNVQELSTMAQQKLPLVAVVFNDNAYGNVRQTQATRFEERFIATDLYNPDLMKLAEAFGIAGRRAKDPAGLRRELRAALAAGEPTLLEVPVPPMGPSAGQQRASRI